MKIAITGGTGLLGRYFTDLLIKKTSHIPIILSRKKKEGSNSVFLRSTDYSITSLCEVLSDIDAVVHLAAVRGNSNLIDDYKENFSLTQNLLEAIVAKKIKNVVYASSISVYSQTEFLPWSESQLPQPSSSYGISKLTCEYISNLYAKNHNLIYKNLRLAHLFGSKEENVYMINKFMKQAFHKKPLVLYSNQKAKREFLYAKDAAEAILCALNAKNLTGTYNIGSGKAYTNYEVAIAVNTAFNNNGNLIIKNIEEKAIKPSYMNNDKAKNQLQFEASYSLLDGLIEIYKEMNHV